MTSLTIGTHNLHDEAGRPTPFADVVFFQEAVKGILLARFSKLRGYELIVCRQQPDLAIAYRRKVFEPEAALYKLAHPGEGGVTPHRGTFVLEGRLVGQPAALQNEHRINAAFPPYKRGEGRLRRQCWDTHTALTLGWDRALNRRGLLVVGGGDLNTPPDVTGYRGVLSERGHGLDRLGVSIGRGAHLFDAEHLDNEGSDHPRLRATLEIR